MVDDSVSMGENILVHRKKVVVLMLQKVMEVLITPLSRGRVRRKNCCTLLAPSRVAAS